MSSRLLLLIGLVLGGVLSFVFTGHPEASWTVAQIDDYFLNVLILVGINVILAVSLNMVNGYTGQFSLGHAGFMAVGAYASSALSIWVKGSSIEWLHVAQTSGPVSFLGTLLFGGVLAGVAGILVGTPSLRLKGDYLAIVTLGFGEIIRVVIQNAEFLGGARGLTGIPTHTTLGWTIGFSLVSIYVVRSLVKSNYGLGFMAVRDDEIAAEAMGVNATRYKVTAFVLGAFFAGIAGGLYAHFIGYISPEGFNFLKSVDVVVMVILGGMGSTLGVTFSAVLLTVLNEVLRETEQFRMIVFSLMLIVLMIWRPQGLIGGAFRRFSGGKRTL